MSDWLGTHRAQISADGNVGNLLEFAGLPFGNGQATMVNSVDATGHFFTDKPRDPESGAGTGNRNLCNAALTPCVTELIRARISCCLAYSG